MAWKTGTKPAIASNEQQKLTVSLGLWRSSYSIHCPQSWWHCCQRGMCSPSRANKLVKSDMVIGSCTSQTRQSIPLDLHCHIWHCLLRNAASRKPVSACRRSICQSREGCFKEPRQYILECAEKRWPVCKWTFIQLPAVARRLPVSELFWNLAFEEFWLGEWMPFPSRSSLRLITPERLSKKTQQFLVYLIRGRKQ